MKKVNIGLIGFGVVGSGVHHILQNNSEIIKNRTGIDVQIKTICDIRTDYVKKTTRNIAVTENWADIIHDDEIDIIVELIGGIDPAHDIIMSALKNHKGVVTANKKLLAEKGRDLFETANNSGSKLRFEAAVSGGIPCILGLQDGLVCNRINNIMGILNGTTNYILSKMEDENISFETALKDAQKKGFAEADPTFDIEGFDAGHKISLLAMLAYNRHVDFSCISIEGITKISEIDINYARDMGYIIKLLGLAREIEGRLDIRVHPTMIPSKHQLASVRDEFNAVMFDGDMTGRVIQYGKGAGSHPTASAVMSDIMFIARNTSRGVSITLNSDAKYIEEGMRLSRYYIRIHTQDRPGILAQISNVFGENGISMSSVMQKETEAEGRFIPLIIMTHEAREDAMLRAKTAIEAFDFVDGEINFIRVEDSLYSGEQG